MSQGNTELLGLLVFPENADNLTPPSSTTYLAMSHSSYTPQIPVIPFSQQTRVSHSFVPLCSFLLVLEMASERQSTWSDFDTSLSPTVSSSSRSAMRFFSDHPLLQSCFPWCTLRQFRDSTFSHSLPSFVPFSFSRSASLWIPSSKLRGELNSLCIME